MRWYWLFLTGNYERKIAFLGVILNFYGLGKELLGYSGLEWNLVVLVRFCLMIEKWTLNVRFWVNVHFLDFGYKNFMTSVRGWFLVLEMGWKELILQVIWEIFEVWKWVIYSMLFLLKLMIFEWVRWKAYKLRAWWDFGCYFW